MKKYLLVHLNCYKEKRLSCIAILVFFMLASCAMLKFNEADREDTITKYEEFLKKYPKGKYADQANKRVEELEWEKSKSLGTILSYQQYINKYPTGRFIDEAYSEIEELLEWEKSKSSNTILSYQQYLNKYPTGWFKYEARSRIEEIEKQKALETAKNIKNVAVFLDNKASYSNTLFEAIRKRLHSFSYNVQVFPLTSDFKNTTAWLLIKVSPVELSSSGLKTASFYDYRTGKSNSTIVSSPSFTATSNVTLTISSNVTFKENISTTIAAEVRSGYLTCDSESLHMELGNKIAGFLLRVLKIE